MENLNPSLSGELTGQSGNTYPNSMPDGPGATPEMYSSQNPTSPEQLAQQARVAGSPEAPEATRNAASEILDLSPEEKRRLEELTRELGRTESVDVKRVISDSISQILNPRPQRRTGAQQGMGGRQRGQEQVEEIPQMPTFDASKYEDPEVKTMAAKLAFAKDNLINDPDLMDEYAVGIQKIIDNSSGDKNTQANDLRQELELAARAVNYKIRQSDIDSRDTYRLYLTTKDFDDLESDPMEWIKHQINKIYNFSAEGQEQSSPLVQGAQQLHERALSWLTHTEQARRDPDLIKKFSEQFSNRLYTMFARSAVQQKNMEGIGGIAGQLGAHGIMNTLSFEGGLVNRMHNRINEMYDDKRITLPQHHVTSVEHAQVQSRVLEEYTRLIMASDDPQLYREIGLDMSAVKGGAMSDARSFTLAEENIRRAVRTAYDHFVASQREAVIVARGDALPTGEDLQGIVADPSALFQMFNMEQLLIAKFGTLNHEQQLFFNAIKRRYAESDLRGKKVKNFNDWAQERIKIDPHIAHHAEEHVEKGKKPDYTRAALEDYGSELMRDLMQVNDWYSSGWKLDEFMKQLDQNMLYRMAMHRKVGHISELSEADRNLAINRAREFGLFMRLRVLQGGSWYKPHGWSEMEGPDQKAYVKAEKEKVWGQIATYKPEDIVRMFREHGAHDGSELKDVDDAFREAGITLTQQDIAEGRVTLYDKFKYQYGGALRLIRELGYNTKNADGNEDFSRLPEQIDFSQIMSNPRYAGLLDRMLSEYGPGQAQKIATLFGKLQKFAGDEKTIKTMMTDTRFNFVNLRTFAVDDGLLDRMEEENLKMGLTSLSRKFAPEPGGDAYKRTFNDATAAAETHKNYITFLTAESEDEKLKAALAAASAVKAYRDPHVASLVFRYTFGSYKLMGAITEKDKGVERTWYELMDWKRKPNKGPINELQEIFGPEAPAFNNDSMLLFLDHHKTDFVGYHGEELWDEMKELSGTKTKNRAKFQIYRGILFFMLWIMYEGYNTTTKTVGEGLKSEDSH